MPIKSTKFGSVGNRDVELYTLTNANGLVLEVMTYGAIVRRLEVPDRHGKLADVVLGFDDLASYTARSPYFGAICGRCSNRIRGGRFELEGRRYELAVNDGPDHLHGGPRGWDKVVWTAEAMETAAGPAVRLSYASRDGDEGYPGTVSASCVYTLTKKDELSVEMQAATDHVTLVNMVHHSYWNLGGAGSGPITDHLLTLHARAFTPGDPVVPTGKIEGVRGTPFDFTAAKAIGADLAGVGGEPVGYDHNFIVDGTPGELRPVARLEHPGSGRVLEIEADQPGVQFYCGKFLDGSLRGKGGKPYGQYGGLCLESQAFPNSVNIPAWRNQVILTADRTYKHLMIHRFTTV
jgi:aldose 1-epimerase